MADQSVHSPTNPHFFRPLLPGFHTQLSLPVAFFAKHVQGSNEHIKIAKLRTDVSAKSWLVKVDGMKLTDGWEDFAAAHTSSTALNKQCQETILVNKEGNSWTASLGFSESGGKYYITRGWRKFCVGNRCEIGDLFVFNVVGDGKTTPLMCVCPESKECSEILSKHLSRKSGNIASSSRMN